MTSHTFCWWWRQNNLFCLRRFGASTQWLARRRSGSARDFQWRQFNASQHGYGSFQPSSYRLHLDLFHRKAMKDAMVVCTRFLPFPCWMATKKKKWRSPLIEYKVSQGRKPLVKLLKCVLVSFSMMMPLPMSTQREFNRTICARTVLVGAEKWHFHFLNTHFSHGIVALSL